MAAGAPLAESLRVLFDSEHDWLAENAAIAWWLVTHDGAPAVPVLIRHLEPGAFSAVECLAQMGPLAQTATPKLREFIESDRRQIRGGVMDELLILDDRWLDACRDTLARIGN